LYLSRARESVVHEATIFEGTFVELPYSGRAQVREAVAKLLELFLIQNVWFFGVGFAEPSRGNISKFALCSPYG